MGNRAAKGSQFERDLCRQLSLWWTQDLSEPNPDVFWRTSGSGGRATMRGRKGEKIGKGSCGDICALDPIGQPLLDLITIEAKKGYNKHTIADLLDKPEGGAKQVYEQWFEQAEESRKNAGAKYWMLIHKKDRREALVVMPVELAEKFTLDFLSIWGGIKINSVYITTFTLKELLKHTDPEQIKELANARTGNPASNA